MKGLDLGGIWQHAFSSEDCTIEGNLGLPGPALQAVEDDAMLAGHLHKLKQVSVMLLVGTAIYAYMIMNGNYAGETVCCLVHADLKDIIGHLQTEGHAQEPVSVMVGVEHGQVGRLLIKVHAPEAILCSQLTETGSTA